MARFSRASLDALNTCDVRLQIVMKEAIRFIDFAVLQGHRGKEAQDKAFKEGKSKKRWPNSLHNRQPSLAVDIAPHPIDWKDAERFSYFAGYIMCIAEMNGYRLRWGGDWDRDKEVKDEKFRDLGHFELAET